ncbi:hypothetical protein Y032_0021g394 [Ancylostoma ceylanicum]|uniref:Uncharacterized protein n=1 Tax=Ancylostoma ceylanicum TaxID=53326 RepID=A0A016V0F2_9BILA|nr:hypothetical protein Y032_0021g394 [Ancylostoma ceylanicum]
MRIDCFKTIVDNPMTVCYSLAVKDRSPALFRENVLNHLDVQVCKYRILQSYVTTNTRIAAVHHHHYNVAQSHFTHLHR